MISAHSVPTDYQARKWQNAVRDLQKCVKSLRSRFHGQKDRSIVLAGFALVWHTVSDNRDRQDGKRLLVRHSEFDLADDAFVYAEHEALHVLASRQSGSAEFAADAHGLFCAFVPQLNPGNLKIIEAIRRAERPGMSIGVKYRPASRSPHPSITTVFAGSIAEVSVVEKPGFAATGLVVLDDADPLDPDEALAADLELADLQRQLHRRPDRWSPECLALDAQLAHQRSELRLLSLY